MQRFASASLLTPDNETEKWLREILGMPSKKEQLTDEQRKDIASKAKVQPPKQEDKEEKEEKEEIEEIDDKEEFHEK